MGTWFSSVIPEIIILGVAGSTLAVLMLKLVRRARDRQCLAASVSGRPRMEKQEKQFREAERQLDELLRRDEMLIAASGITITDRSTRAYNYKTETLVWDHWFESRRQRGFEVENVWVVLTLYDYDSSLLRVSKGADIFQPGQLSRWRSTTQEELPLEDVVKVGLSTIVIDELRAYRAMAAAVA